MPSVVHDNLRPEAGLEDWRGEMGSAVSDWVAPQAPGFIHLQPRRLSLQVLVSPNLPSKDKTGQEHKNVDMVMVGSMQSGKYLADMIFVQLFTPSEFQANIFTPLYGNLRSL